MAQNNAAIFLDKNQTKVERDFNSTTGAMLHLMKALSLESMPRRIECYDISNISGTDKVASMVVFTNGTKDTKSYRRFRIKTVEGANDFACMKEVIFRRLTRIKNGDLDFGAKPDLIVVDGGKGQLSYAVKAMEEAGVKIPFASLAKKKNWFSPGQKRTCRNVQGLLRTEAAYQPQRRSTPLRHNLFPRTPR